MACVPSCHASPFQKHEVLPSLSFFSRSWSQVTMKKSSRPKVVRTISSLNASPLGTEASTERYIKLLGTGGLRIVEMTTENGSACRILVNEARVTSYEAKMWHGGADEILYCQPNETEAEGKGPLRGGIALSFPRGDGILAGRAAHPLAEGAVSSSWEVQAMAVEAGGERSEVVLSAPFSYASDPPAIGSPPLSQACGCCLLTATFSLSSSALSVSFSIAPAPSEKSAAPTETKAASFEERGEPSPSGAASPPPPLYGDGSPSDADLHLPLVASPSICAHLAVASLRSVRLVGLQGSTVADFGSRGGAAGGGRGGWLSALWRGRPSEPEEEQQRSHSTAVGGPDSSREEGGGAGAGEGGGDSASGTLQALTAAVEDRVREVVGGWGEGGGVRRFVADTNPLSLVAPTKLLVEDAAATLLDRGRRLSTALTCNQASSLFFITGGEGSAIPDSDAFVVTGCTVRTPLVLTETTSEGSLEPLCLKIINLGAP